VCLALVAGAYAEDPCEVVKAQCRDVLCAGREVLSNDCQQGDFGFSKSCACGDALEEAALGKAQEADVMTEDEMPCDEEADEEEEEETEQGRPMLTFALNMGRRFGPSDDQQAPRVFTFSRMGGDEGSDVMPLLPRLGMLFNAMRARQQFLQDSPSYMTRRVYYQPEGATVYRLVNHGELAEMQEDEAQERAEEEAQERAIKQVVVDRMQQAVRERLAERAADDVRSRFAPMAAIKLAKAPSAAYPRDAQPAVQSLHIEEKQYWYQGYRAQRALYCVASITLILSVIALNASLLMCCAASREDRDVDVEVVAATTPLLVEYQVEKVSNPCKEAAPAEFKPLPREGIKA